MNFSKLWPELFPLPLPTNVEAFVTERLALATNATALEAQIGTTQDKDVLKELRDISLNKMKGEDDRQSSIMSRAQALYVTMALFGFVLTLSSSLLTSASSFDRSWLLFCGVPALFVVAQIILIMWNVLRALRGIGAPIAGSTELKSWISQSNLEGFYRTQALDTLRFYRRAAVTNDWRIAHLDQAFIGLRNSIIALSLMALTFLVLAWIKDAPNVCSHVRGLPLLMKHLSGSC